jgi:hypothetical protein
LCQKIISSVKSTAYSEKDNIRYAKKNQLELIFKLNTTITHGHRKKEEEFEFNKGAGMYVCQAGHMAIRRARKVRVNVGKNQRDTYFFDVEKCKVCLFREGCYKRVRKVNRIL